MTASSLIDAALGEIAQRYQPGTLPWVKMNKPEKWMGVVSLEEKINQVAFKSDMEGLKKALLDYKRLILSMVMERKSYDK